MYNYLHIYIYTYIHVCKNAKIHTYINIYLHIHTYLHIYISTYLHIHIYIYISIYINIYRNIYIYIYYLSLSLFLSVCSFEIRLNAPLSHGYRKFPSYGRSSGSAFPPSCQPHHHFSASSSSWEVYRVWTARIHGWKHYILTGAKPCVFWGKVAIRGRGRRVSVSAVWGLDLQKLSTKRRTAARA